MSYRYKVTEQKKATFKVLQIQESNHTLGSL